MSSKQPKTKLLLLVALGLAGTLAACSFSTNYVVANDSKDRIQVRFVLKKTNSGIPHVYPPSVLGIKLVSEVGEQKPWRDLSASQLTFNAETRTVVVTLMPQEALRVEQMTDTKCEDEDPGRAERFSIEEISVTGSDGAIRLQGKQARRSFVSGPRSTCVLTYR